MDEKVALHTAARHYCMEREPRLHALFWEQVEERFQQDHPDASDDELRQAGIDASGTAAQWEMLGEILFGLEQLTPEEFPTTDLLRAELLSIGRDAEPDMSTWSGPDLTREMEEERDLFRAYVESLSSVGLRTVEPLYHRRMLSDREADKLWRRVNRHWGASPDSLWYPLNNGEPPAPNVLAFNTNEFSDNVPTSTLRSFLAARRIRRLWELQWDFGLVYEIDLEIFRPGGSETYWTSEMMDWIVYTSHEGSITIGGEWLLNLVMYEWPDCDKHLRTTHLPPAVIAAVKKSKDEFQPEGS
jgi:hypothetical protein